VVVRLLLVAGVCMRVIRQHLLDVAVVVPLGITVLVIVRMLVLMLMGVLVSVSVGMDLIAMPMLVGMFVMVLVAVLVHVIVGALHWDDLRAATHIHGAAGQALQGAGNL